MISKLQRNDLILISVCLVLAVLLLLVMNFTRKEGGYATVVVNGVETASHPLNQDAIITLSNDETNGYNLLVIKSGYASIVEANCPDKLCVRQRKIKYNGQTLVCLPNKTTVKIVSNTNSDTDFIS